MTASVESKEQVLIWPTDQLAHVELGWLEDGHEVGVGQLEGGPKREEQLVDKANTS